MISGLSVLALVVARGGSKGLPRKNVLDLGGKPLVAWTVEAGRSSKYIDRLILSTDDEEIRAAAVAAGCEAPFRRPAELATDEAGIMDVIWHAVDSLENRYDLVVLLQATSPFRTAADIDACVERCALHGAVSCVSVTEASKNPYWMFHLDADGCLVPVIGQGALGQRRQNLPLAYALNGAVYVARVDWLRGAPHFVGEQTVAYAMPAERSVDVDSAFDLEVARAIIGNSLLFTGKE